MVNQPPLFALPSRWSRSSDLLVDLAPPGRSKGHHSAAGLRRTPYRETALYGCCAYCCALHAAVCVVFVSCVLLLPVQHITPCPFTVEIQSLWSRNYDRDSTVVAPKSYRRSARRPRNAMPSYQAVHTHASNPDTLKERKRKYKGRKENKEKRIERTKNSEKNQGNKYPENIRNSKGRPMRGRRQTSPSLRQDGWIRNEVVPPRRCGRRNKKTKKQANKQDIISSDRREEGTENRNASKSRSNQQQQFTVRAAWTSSTYYIVSLAPCYLVCRVLPAFVNHVLRVSSTARGSIAVVAEKGRLRQTRPKILNEYQHYCCR